MDDVYGGGGPARTAGVGATTRAEGADSLREWQRERDGAGVMLVSFRLNCFTDLYLARASTTAMRSLIGDTWRNTST